jgi:biopolymer transport protein ExbD
MRFPRNAKIFRGQLDAAPLAGVIFLILIFFLLHNKLAYTPGIRVDLPEVKYELAGTPNPKLIIVVDVAGHVYYENQLISDEGELFRRLKIVTKESKVPLTLELQADRSGKLETVLRMISLAKTVGFENVLCVARPKLVPLRSEQPVK